MPYTKVGFQDGTGPTMYPGLEHMDQGIYDAHQTLSSSETLSTVTNIAALRALTSAQINPRVYILGYYTNSDGGEGLFWRDNSVTGVGFNADASTDTITANGHGFILGERVRFSGGSLPGGVTAGVDYWVTAPTTNTFKIAAVRTEATFYSPTPVNITANGSGTATLGDNGGTVIVDAAGARWRRVTDGKRYQVDWFGAKGDKSQYDTLYIDNTIQAAKCAGVRVVEFNPKKSYLLNRRVASQQQPAIEFRENISLEGNNCELVLRDNAAFMGVDWQHFVGAPSVTVTAAVTYGTKTLTVNSTTGFVIGDDVFIRLGQSQWDPGETIYPLQATVTALTSTTITVDRPLQVSISAGDISAASTDNKAVWVLYDRPKGGYARNFRLITDAANGGNAESGVDLGWSKNYVLENIHGNNTSLHIVARYPEKCKIKNCGAVNQINATGHSAKGRIINCWGSNGVIFEDCYGEYFEKNFAYIEFYAKGVQIIRPHIVENHPSVNSGQGTFVVIHGSEVAIEGAYIEASGSQPLVAEGGTEGYNHYHFRDTNLRYTGTPSYTGPLNYFQGDLIWQVAGSASDPNRTATTEFQLSNSQEYFYYIPLVNSMANTEEVFAPPGLLQEVSVYTSPNITVNTDLTSLYVGRSGAGGGDLRSLLVAGTTVRREHSLGYNDAVANAYTGPVMASVGTAASGVGGVDKFLIVKARVAPYEWQPNQAYSSAVAKRMHGIA